jgi:pterin-4a-carbinolamine dehydratase/ribosomal protein S18 acetylase RimI-like enzyme
MEGAMETLSQERCVACRRGAPQLTDDELAQLRTQIPDWQVVERDGVRRLERVFGLRNFAAALTFANHIGALAEAEGHHPAILTEWGRVTVSWWTHKIGGLHRNDAVMAAKTDRIFAELNERASKPTASAPPGVEAVVSLREITAETLWPVLKLKVAPGQEHFVAPNDVSIAQAHFEPKAWFRAIYADETPVGFVMLYDDPEQSKYFLWRLMIAAEHQRTGYGRQAITQLLDYVRTRPGATQLLVSYHPGQDSPRDFYAGLGFEETGETVGEEVVMRLPLQSE